MGWAAGIRIAVVIRADMETGTRSGVNLCAPRNDYIQVILDRSPESQERFVAKHFRRKNLQRVDRVTVWKLLEMQRHAMLMYTSCGWFFDELSGLETVQVI